MCKWGTTVPMLVTIPADLSCTGEIAQRIKPIDACIAAIVYALNVAGIKTSGSCCGHGKADGWIVLNDGRELIVRPSTRSSCIGKTGEVIEGGD